MRILSRVDARSVIGYMLTVFAGCVLGAASAYASPNVTRVIVLTNSERAQAGLTPLVENALLARAAQLKAEDMAQYAYYAHVSPDGKTPEYWIGRTGYSYRIIGENLVVNRIDAESVVSAFMGSSGHRANILRADFTEIGVGVAEGTYKGRDAIFTVQMFGDQYVAPVPSKASAPVTTVKELPTQPILATVPRGDAPMTLVPEPVVPQPVSSSETIVARVQELAEPVTRVLEAGFGLGGVATSSSVIATTTSTALPDIEKEFIAPQVLIPSFVSRAPEYGQESVRRFTQITTAPRADVSWMEHALVLWEHMSTFVQRTFER